ncbi:MAG: hypothetical protein U0797_13005 [Gemmataceae bacterium]
MNDHGTRRTFLQQSAAAVTALRAAEGGMGKAKYVCVTCGIQHAETDGRRSAAAAAGCRSCTATPT